MADSSVISSAFVTGTTPVNIPNSNHCYSLTMVRGYCISANAPAGTNLIVKDGDGNTVVTVPVCAPGALLTAYTGQSINVDQTGLNLDVVDTLATVQLSSNLSSGSIAMTFGLNKAN